MKRIFLFLGTNLAIMVMIGVLVSLTGASHFMARNGLDLGRLLTLSLIMGFTGSFVSLAMSKWMAKLSTGAKVIGVPATREEAWLVDTVSKLASKAGIDMPEVAIYEGEPNAFATGMTKNSSLVAVSTGLLDAMSEQEVEAVLAHEISHAANGDMVTMTLVQGVMNTFVFFIARVVGFLVDSALRKNDEDSGPGWGYGITVFVMDLLLGILASMVVMWFSRRREFAADAGSAKLLGNAIPMIAALQALGRISGESLPPSLAAAGVSGKLSGLFATHPSIEERIEALRSLPYPR